MESVDDLLASVALEDGVVRQLNSDHHQSDVLRGIGFGRSDPDLGTSLKSDDVLHAGAAMNSH